MNGQQIEAMPSYCVIIKSAKIRNVPRRAVNCLRENGLVGESRHLDVRRLFLGVVRFGIYKCLSPEVRPLPAAAIMGDSKMQNHRHPPRHYLPLLLYIHWHSVDTTKLLQAHFVFQRIDSSI